MRNVKWGKFKIEKLFQSKSGNVDIQKKHINGLGINVITSGVADYGILGKTDVEAAVFPSGTITVDMFGNAFYRSFEYKMVTHARVFSLIPRESITEAQGVFISSSLGFLCSRFGFENMCTWDKIKDFYIKLPSNINGEVDYNFMESFIAELEAERVAELEAERVAELSAYLKVSGFDNYELSAQELKTLDDLECVKWEKYRIGELFEKIKTNKLPYKAKELPTEASAYYALPCLTSSFKNQGLNYYAPKQGATVLKSVITIPQNSDVYRAYYQSSDFTVLSDAYAIDWIYDNRKLSREQYLFFVMCINKVTDLPIYSYKNKLGGWNVVKDKFILLPQVNGEIDYNYMNLFISAIEKLSIKSVVDFTDQNIEATKEIINQ